MENFTLAVDEGLRLAKRVCYGKDRYAPPKPPIVMDKSMTSSSAPENLQPMGPMMYAVIYDPAMVDNPDLPSYQPHVYGRIDPPALIPLQMNEVGLEIECFLDSAVVTMKGSWRPHCVMGSWGCDCRLVVPMGEQNDLVHGWGLDFALRRCVESAHEKIGVVDSQWIVHLGIPSLGDQGKTIGRTWKVVNDRCFTEWSMFLARMSIAEALDLEESKSNQTYSSQVNQVLKLNIGKQL